MADRTEMPLSSGMITQEITMRGSHWLLAANWIVGRELRRERSRAHGRAEESTAGDQGLLSSVCAYRRLHPALRATHSRPYHAHLSRWQ
jgi:hypothetical protein